MGVSKYLKNFLFRYGLAWVVGSLVVLLSPQAFMPAKEAHMVLNFFGPMAGVMLLAGVFLMVLGIRSVMRQHQFDLSVWGDLQKSDMFPFCLGVIVVALLTLLILEYVGIADTLTRSVAVAVIVLGLCGVYLSIRFSIDMYRRNLDIMVQQVMHMVGERQLKRLLEQLMLHMRQYGHESEEVQAFIDTHKDVPEFVDLARQYIKVFEMERRGLLDGAEPLDMVHEEHLRELFRTLHKLAKEYGTESRAVRVFVRENENVSEFSELAICQLMVIEMGQEELFDGYLAAHKDELNELLADLVEIAEEHGHDSEQVHNFFEKNGHLPNVRKVGEKILLSLKRV
jgi:nitrate reductase gamma subunit